MSPVEVTIKTWIMPLLDSPNKKIIQGVRSTRLETPSDWTRGMIKHWNTTILMIAIVVLKQVYLRLFLSYYFLKKFYLWLLNSNLASISCAAFGIIKPLPLYTPTTTPPFLYRKIFGVQSVKLKYTCYCALPPYIGVHKSLYDVWLQLFGKARFCIRYRTRYSRITTKYPRSGWENIREVR